MKHSISIPILNNPIHTHTHLRIIYIYIEFVCPCMLLCIEMYINTDKREYDDTAEWTMVMGSLTFKSQTTAVEAAMKEANGVACRRSIVLCQSGYKFRKK